MDYKELVRFLQKQGQFYLVEDTQVHFQNVLKNSLRAKDEHVLVMSDYGKPNKRASALMAAGFYMAAKKLGLDATLALQKVKTRMDNAEPHIQKALKELPEKSIILLSSYNTLGKLHKIDGSFRRMCEERKHRFCSGPGLSELPTKKFVKLMNAIDVDYHKMQLKAERIGKAITKGKEMHITTAKGTDIWMEMKKAKPVLNTGNYTKPGTGGNLPAGEVYFPPDVGTTEGKLIVDGSLRHRDGTAFPRKPVVLRIKSGEIIKIEGSAQGKKLISTLNEAKKKEHGENARKICELGIGINPNADFFGPTVLNEKAYGTAHMANGNNVWFGGEIRAPVHLDHIFKKPKIEIDGKIFIV
ncbi:aminopeptidase [Candidatus Woesearchaeota archaeon]|nr:aminopeptidase [Candidatus Woesearchaeota archaeon]